MYFETRKTCSFYDILSKLSGEYLLKVALYYGQSDPMRETNLMLTRAELEFFLLALNSKLPHEVLPHLPEKLTNVTDLKKHLQQLIESMQLDEDRVKLPPEFTEMAKILGSLKFAFEKGNFDMLFVNAFLSHDLGKNFGVIAGFKDQLVAQGLIVLDRPDDGPREILKKYDHDALLEKIFQLEDSKLASMLRTDLIAVQVPGPQIVQGQMPHHHVRALHAQFHKAGPYALDFAITDLAGSGHADAEGNLTYRYTPPLVNAISLVSAAARSADIYLYMIRQMLNLVRIPLGGRLPREILSSSDIQDAQLPIVEHSVVRLLMMHRCSQAIANRSLEDVKEFLTSFIQNVVIFCKKYPELASVMHQALASDSKIFFDFCPDFFLNIGARRNDPNNAHNDHKFLQNVPETLINALQVFSLRLKLAGPDLESQTGPYQRFNLSDYADKDSAFSKGLHDPNTFLAAEAKRLKERVAEQSTMTRALGGAANLFKVAKEHPCEALAGLAAAGVAVAATVYGYSS